MVRVAATAGNRLLAAEPHPGGMRSPDGTGTYARGELKQMSASDLEKAQQFQSAAENAMCTGNFGPVVAFLAGDVECVTPQHSVHGVEALTDELSRARPTERFDIEFENGDWKEAGGGRYSCEVRVHFRSKVNDDLSYTRDRSFELTIRDGKVSRYEMFFAD